MITWWWKETESLECCCHFPPEISICDASQGFGGGGCGAAAGRAGGGAGAAAAGAGAAAAAAAAAGGPLLLESTTTLRTKIFSSVSFAGGTPVSSHGAALDENRHVFRELEICFKIIF